MRETVADGGNRAGVPKRGAPAPVSFSRHELKLILGLYERKVAKGEWRDYALDFLMDRALFSAFRHSQEHAFVVIEKDPGPGARQGQFLVTNGQGRVLRRGPGLEQVLRVLEPGLALVE